MSGENTKNYQQQGGAVWVVNGTLSIGAGGVLLMHDTVNGKTYQITIENGVMTPVEV